MVRKSPSQETQLKCKYGKKAKYNAGREESG